MRITTPRVSLQGLGMSLVPDLNSLTTSSKHRLALMMIDTRVKVATNNGLNRLSTKSTQILIVSPLLDDLVVAARYEQGGGGVHAEAAHEPVVCVERVSARACRQVPDLDLAVART